MREHVKTFVREETTVKVKKDRISKDTDNENVLSMLQAIGLYGKLMTGPWMVHLYVKDSHKDHMDSAKLFGDLMTNLYRVKDEPSLTFTTDNDFFNKPLQEDPDAKADEVFIALRSRQENGLLVKIRTLAIGMIACLERQLHIDCKRTARSDPAEGTTAAFSSIS